MTLPDPTLSATIAPRTNAETHGGRGGNANRVRIAKRKRQRRPPPERRWRTDPTVAGKPYATPTFSIPAEDLAELDAFCERVKMSRSAVLRVAWRYYRLAREGER